MNLVVIQRPERGLLGGSKELQLDIAVNKESFKTCISQLGQRTISVSSEGHYENLQRAYYDISTLLMLFDGQFYPTEQVFLNGQDVTHNWLAKELLYFSSADFLIGINSKLIEFDSTLDKNVLQKWDRVRHKLDIIHNIVLYCTSDVKMPIDIKCVFMIESFEGIYELLKTYDKEFKKPDIPKTESKLKYYLQSIMEQYGLGIFSKEQSLNSPQFLRILVDSRNRIAHIKRKQDVFLDGQESLVMIQKLFILYRTVFFKLLGIPRSLYETRLKEVVSSIDSRKTMIVFFIKLQEASETT